MNDSKDRPSRGGWPDNVQAIRYCPNEGHEAGPMKIDRDAKVPGWFHGLEAIRILPGGEVQLEGLPDGVSEGWLTSEERDLELGLARLLEKALVKWFGLRAKLLFAEMDAALKEKEA